MLPIHQQFINQAMERIRQDSRLTGLLIGGSVIRGTVDVYSDLDLIVVYDIAFKEEIMEQRIRIANSFGSLLSAFTGEHVGEPRLVICLYGPQPLHVDLKFISSSELAVRVENPLVLWDRDNSLRSIINETSPSYPTPTPQWMEDRFWVWVHYGATKLGRGELFEFIDLLSYIRSVVLGPLILMNNGHIPSGVRRLEQYAAHEMEELKETLPLHNAPSCYHALKASIEIYRRLRQDTEGLIRKEEAEQAAIVYLDSVYDSVRK
ncbi:nucleotidyltransferase domain-containing protein [Paenibacillus lautus]|uniref:nucleotidyltransferase domain-containing protein n=1 Tax=Paenibacillus lautus TaxID=1401 RepID=UPI003D2D60C0